MLGSTRSVQDPKASNGSRLRQNISINPINGVKLAQQQGPSRHRPGSSTRSNFCFDSSGALHSKPVPFPRSVLSPLQNRSSAVDADASLREKGLRDLLSTHSKDGPDYYDESNSDDEVLGDWLEGKTLVEAAAEINVTDEIDNDDVSAEFSLGLVQQLAEPFDKQSAEIKKDMMETLEPALKRIHLVLSYISKEVDEDKFVSSGIHALNTQSEQHGEAIQTQATTLQNRLEESQSRIKDLFEALRVAEEKRNAWWDRCFALVDEAERLVEGVKLEVDDAVETATIQNEKKVKAHLSENGVGKGRGKGFEFDKLKAVMMEL